MLQEELVTHEVAKLAREKGFPVKEIECWHYEYDGHPTKEIIDEQQYPIITQSLLQRWLREEKGYYVYPYYDNNEYQWTYSIREKTGDMWILLVGETPYFLEYEEAMEAGLKYVLESLV